MTEPAGNTGSSTGHEPGSAQEYMTPNQVAEVVNRAVTARNTQIEKRVEKLLEEKLKEMASGWAAKLEELQTSSKGKKDKGDDDPQARGIQRQLDEQKALTEQLKAELTATKTQAKNSSLRQKVGDSLVNNGVDQTRIKHALAWLVDSNKSVQYDEGDNIVFVDETGAAIDLDSGIKSWLKTDDGKSFMPARGPIGSGDRPAGNLQRGKNGEIDKAALNAGLMGFFTGRSI